MEFYPLLYFVTVAKTGNLTQAAKQLGSISRPLSDRTYRTYKSYSHSVFAAVSSRKHHAADNIFCINQAPDLLYFFYNLSYTFVVKYKTIIIFSC